MTRLPLVMVVLAVAGCGSGDGISMLHPHGLVADSQRRWLIDINLLMAIVVVPVFVLVPWFAWRYRRRSTRSTYNPNWTFYWPLEFAVWGIPVLVVIALAVLIIVQQAKLDPYERLVKSSKPLEIQVVGLDWKWLFVYPEQRIATVSMIAIPEGRPVVFHITSDATMQSFFIPALGSQIYAMAGMVTELHLIADRRGRVMGENAQFNGDHFQDQKFDVDVIGQGDFDAWVAKQQADGKPLDARAYDTVSVHGTTDKAKRMFGIDEAAILSFKNVDPNFFASIVDKFNPGAMHMAGSGSRTGAPAMQGMQ